MNTEKNNDGLTPEMECMIERVLGNVADDCEMALVEEWVASSGANRLVFEHKRAIHNMLEPPFKSSAIDAREALRKVHMNMRGSRHRSRWFEIVMRCAAVMFLPLLGVCFFLMSRGDLSGHATQGNVCMVSPYGAKVESVLPDGSHVWLNANSRLEYPASFDGDERQVSLTGEGYFEVEADRNHPFVVKTANGDVTAVGTSFNVNSYDGTALSVTLVKGFVDVQSGRDVYELAAGDRLEVTESGAEMISDADMEKACGWKDGVLMFDNDRLEDVFARLSQLYPVDFEICDPQLAGMRYHATFKGETLQDIIRLLEDCVPMRCETTESNGRQLVQVYPVR